MDWNSAIRNHQFCNLETHPLPQDGTDLMPLRLSLDTVHGTRVALAAVWEAWKMIRKLKSGKYRLYSRKPDAKTGKRKNLGTFDSRAAAEKHERAVQYFKRH